MGEKQVILSQHSQDLIKEYLVLEPESASLLRQFSSTVDVNLVVQWLGAEESLVAHENQKKEKDNKEFILASLRASLLKDLVPAIGDKKDSSDTTKPKPKSNKLKFILLTAAGTILAACEGFDSVSTIMEVFALPSAATVVLGVVFSIVSVLVFYGFNLVQLSKNLGVKLTDARKLIDVYMEQMDQIKALRKKIHNYGRLDQLSEEELLGLQAMLAMLQKRFDSLTLVGKQFHEALNSTSMKVAKGVFAGISGILFFGGGFFAGQSVAVFLLGLVMAGGVSATAWPVLVFGFAVALAAFALYWYVERVSVEQLISGWLGLDEEKIELLSDKEKFGEEQQVLLGLKDRLDEAIAQKNCVNELQRKLSGLMSTEQPVAVLQLPVLQESAGEVLQEEEVPCLRPPSTEGSARSSNIYSFHRSILSSSERTPLLAEEEEESDDGVTPRAASSND
jgi:hypothetical protein